MIGATGGFTVVSDDLSLYGDAEWAALDQLRSRLASVDVPLTLEDPFSPTVTVSSAHHRLEVDVEAARVLTMSGVVRR